jgi:hypothetical protein
MKLRTATLLTLLALPATASQHLMKVREVGVGPSDDASAQYIVLQMYANGQNQVQGNTVRVYNATDAIVGQYTFATPVANGASQASILLATPEAERRYGVAADLVITADLIPTAGKVCFESFDCVAWGDYLGDAVNPDDTGTPFARDTGITPGTAIRRDISAGNPQLLEAGDDTGDSAQDFERVAPAPVNNAGIVGGDSVVPSPTPAPSSTPSPTPAPASDDGSGGGGAGSPLLWAGLLLAWMAGRRRA